MGLSMGYLGGEQTEESHHRGCRPKIPQRQEDRKEEKGEAETIRSPLMGCLTAEITKGSPKLGLWQKLLAGDRAEMWELENSNFFIRGLANASYIQITGSTQRTNREGKVNWRFTLLTDRATEGVGGIVILEAKGYPWATDHRWS